MGLSKKEITKKYASIPEFSELQRFESMKLKNFSSGMVMRLAFATAIQTDPDIFLVDEVLSVGDEAFQRKCKAKMEEIRRAGKTIVLVSHDMGLVQELCKRCILLYQGGIFTLGDTNDVIEKYRQIMKK
jgi:ABC-type polysaccharide/polyol phosphate transport system ATPase subunit